MYLYEKYVKIVSDASYSLNGTCETCISIICLIKWFDKAALQPQRVIVFYTNSNKDYKMSLNNSSHFSHDLSLDEIPGFEVRTELTNPGTSSEISWLSVDKLRRAYTARLSEME